jgi:hypothetical protein
MLSRFAGRMLTGPLAFLTAGILDLVAYAVSRRPRASV